jgi:hypothetical protein
MARPKHSPNDSQNLRADDRYERPDRGPFAALSAPGELGELVMAVLEPARTRGTEKTKHDDTGSYPTRNKRVTHSPEIRHR